MHCSNGTTERLTETCLFPPERAVSKNSVMGPQISNRNPGIVQTSNTYRAPVFTGGSLRHPSFRGLRDDKTADEVDLPGRH